MLIKPKLLLTILQTINQCTKWIQCSSAASRDTQIPTLRHFCLVFCFVTALPADGEDVTALSTPLIKRIISSTSLSLSNVEPGTDPAGVDVWLTGPGDSAGDWWSSPPASVCFFLSFYTIDHVHSLPVMNNYKLPTDTGPVLFSLARPVRPDLVVLFHQPAGSGPISQRSISLAKTVGLVWPLPDH